MTVQFPARIIYPHPLMENQIVIHRETIPPFSTELEAQIQAEWEYQQTLNRSLTNGKMLVARRHEIVGDEFHLYCGESDYAHFMGTTALTSIPEEQQHRAIGVMCLVRTSDNFLMFGIRNPIIDWGTMCHVMPACRMRSDDKNPHAALWREAKAETGLEQDDFTWCECRGVVSDETVGRKNYEMVFYGKTKLYMHEFSARALSAASANEHIQVVPFPWTDPKALRAFLLMNPRRWVPTGWAGTILALQQEQLTENIVWNPSPATYHEYMEKQLELITTKK